mmetsp:Transcript_57805/g.163105  ORF Transcript_57805/g.163105 Transcript_57805/m.163105 type:complete len:222 (-) Transcript_57805:91-756(-)
MQLLVPGTRLERAPLLAQEARLLDAYVGEGVDGLHGGDERRRPAAPRAGQRRGGGRRLALPAALLLLLAAAPAVRLLLLTIAGILVALRDQPERAGVPRGGRTTSALRLLLVLGALDPVFRELDLLFVVLLDSLQLLLPCEQLLFLHVELRVDLVKVMLELEDALAEQIPFEVNDLLELLDSVLQERRRGHGRLEVLHQRRVGHGRSEVLAPRRALDGRAH